jgi:hypothetical protein
VTPFSRTHTVPYLLAPPATSDQQPQLTPLESNRQRDVDNLNLPSVLSQQMRQPSRLTTIDTGIPHPPPRAKSNAATQAQRACSHPLLALTSTLGLTPEDRPLLAVCLRYFKPSFFRLGRVFRLLASQLAAVIRGAQTRVAVQPQAAGQGRRRKCLRGGHREEKRSADEPARPSGLREGQELCPNWSVCSQITRVLFAHNRSGQD